jgi:hypothetical protein
VQLKEAAELIVPSVALIAIDVARYRTAESCSLSLPVPWLSSRARGTNMAQTTTTSMMAAVDSEVATEHDWIRVDGDAPIREYADCRRIPRSARKNFEAIEQRD